jgi:hypothetical protein
MFRKKIRRRARELGYELRTIPNTTITMPDWEVVAVDSHGEILATK